MPRGTETELLRPLAIAVLLAGLAVGTAACNTIEGVGEDVGAAGDAIDREAEEAQD